MDEDDELSEVQPDAVPPEVREWLASTFTRQLATSRRKTDEKPKFRSVAHAIRAGIFVDRMYRRVTSATIMQFPDDVVRVLKVRRSSLHEFAKRVHPPTFTKKMPGCAFRPNEFIIRRVVARSSRFLKPCRVFRSSVL